MFFPRACDNLVGVVDVFQGWHPGHQAVRMPQIRHREDSIDNTVIDSSVNLDQSFQWSTPQHMLCLGSGPEASTDWKPSLVSSSKCQHPDIGQIITDNNLTLFLTLLLSLLDIEEEYPSDNQSANIGIRCCPMLPLLLQRYVLYERCASILWASTFKKARKVLQAVWGMSR
jgi:hypothetical protein